MAKTREQIYTEKIAPLMSQIFEICQKHKMPLFLILPVDRESGLTTVMALLSEEYNPPPVLVSMLSEFMQHIEPQEISIRA